MELMLIKFCDDEFGEVFITHFIGGVIGNGIFKLRCFCLNALAVPGSAGAG